MLSYNNTDTKSYSDKRSYKIALELFVVYLHLSEMEKKALIMFL